MKNNKINFKTPNPSEQRLNLKLYEDEFLSFNFNKNKKVKCDEDNIIINYKEIDDDSLSENYEKLKKDDTEINYIKILEYKHNSQEFNN